MRERDIYSLGIVLIGNFNPVIINPSWLAAKGLIREAEEETAKIQVIHPEITRFELDWLSFEATPLRMDFKTNRESHISVMKDLIVSIFGMLKETPITACGINHLSHYTLRNEVEYQKFGYWFSPVTEFKEVLNDPKLFTLQYQETKKDDPEFGLMRLIISPSDLILDNKSILINCNHHFENTKTDAKNMINLITKQWEYSFQKSQNLNNLIWEKVNL